MPTTGIQSPFTCPRRQVYPLLTFLCLVYKDRKKHVKCLPEVRYITLYSFIQLVFEYLLSSRRCTKH